jgi:hypothetical protein
VPRPARGDDHAAAAVEAAPAPVLAAIAAGRVAPSWWRTLEDGRRERYGFEVVAVAALAVWSANNAFVAADSELTPAVALTHALVVAVVAPVAAREARLARRSPDLVAARQAEVAARLAEPTPPAHVVIDNGGAEPALAGAALVALVRAVAPP